MKYLFVVGGVVSGLGKGITISSIGVLLRACGLRVTAIKIDPYLNTDAGTMSPFEHGEVFVLNDGGEADLDLGNYERFLGVRLTRSHNLTTGKVYAKVIARERRGDYLGKTVQVVPHVTDAIQEWIEETAAVPVDDSGEPADVCLVELGGTVGDIESMPFLEALRQFPSRVGRSNCSLLLVSLVPVLGAVGEQKTKPTQHGVKALQHAGLTPDFIVGRASTKLLPSTTAKLALFCGVSKAHVFSVHDVSNIYRVPLLLRAQAVHSKILAVLGLAPPRAPTMGAWERLADTVDSMEGEAHIALVGKYTGLSDSYLSVIKALKHSGVAVKRRVVIDWVEASDLEPVAPSATRKERAAAEEAWRLVKEADGILVPGGFGNRGVEGMILASKYARENKVPYLGVCLGLQMAVIDFARHVVGWEDAFSSEWLADGGVKAAGLRDAGEGGKVEDAGKAEEGDDAATDAYEGRNADHCAVLFMPEIDRETMGGTMRLGGRRTMLRRYGDKPSIAERLYALSEDEDSVIERHRHRYEVNPAIVPTLEEAGLRFVGRDDSGERMEIVELAEEEHPFWLATQYHPEFLTGPHQPSRPFLGFVAAASGQLEAIMTQLADGAFCGDASEEEEEEEE